MSWFPPQQRQYFESFPLWAVALWAIGVFGGVIGCLLLLLKNRLAFHVLLASLIGRPLQGLALRAHRAGRTSERTAVEIARGVRIHA